MILRLPRKRDYLSRRLLPGRDEVLYFPKRGGDDPGSAQPARIDAMEYVARVLAGFYSNAARGKRRDRDGSVESAAVEQEPATTPEAAALRKRWADLLRRVHEIDPLVCPRCSATMHVVGFITQPQTIERILDHLRRSTSRPRSPPVPGTQVPAACS